jgi:hypothetical protein
VLLTACSRSTRGTKPQITIWTRGSSPKLTRFWLTRQILCFPRTIKLIGMGFCWARLNKKNVLSVSMICCCAQNLIYNTLWETREKIWRRF